MAPASRCAPRSSTSPWPRAASRCRSRHKVDATREKLLLRRAFRDLWPDSVANRAKQGFGSPMAHWLATARRRRAHARAPRATRALRCSTSSTTPRCSPMWRLDDQRTWNLLSVGAVVGELLTSGGSTHEGRPDAGPIRAVVGPQGAARDRRGRADDVRSPVASGGVGVLVDLGLFLVAAVGIAAFGHVLNDLADIRTDAARRRTEPRSARCHTAPDRRRWSPRLVVGRGPWIWLPRSRPPWHSLAPEIGLLVGLLGAAGPAEGPGLPPGVLADALYAYVVPVLLTIVGLRAGRRRRRPGRGRSSSP